ncbi:MAG: hypothetical protein R3320_08975 [Nitriliruptorales bacterium]|nr:hypothetical protein [Nitriliruptorales bacterium]
MGWYLAKGWEDQDDGIDMVLVHYSWSPLGHGPDWGAVHECRVLEDLGGFPRRRRKVLSMPAAVWDGGGWNPEFALHHYFEVFQRGGQWTTQLYTEEIASRELEFYDEPGLITNICIYWGVGDFTAPVYSPMEDPRFPSDSEFTSIRYYDYQDKARYHWAKAQMLSEIPPPHRWWARMWGPRGSTLVQQYHIGRMYPEDQQGEFFYGPDGVTHAGGSHWTHLL